MTMYSAVYISSQEQEHVHISEELQPDTVIHGVIECSTCRTASRHTHLFGQVVDAHGILRGHKEEGFGGVERHAHDPPTVLAEGVLRDKAGQLVHQHRLQQAARGIEP